MHWEGSGYFIVLTIFTIIDFCSHLYMLRNTQ